MLINQYICKMNTITYIYFIYFEKKNLCLASKNRQVEPETNNPKKNQGVSQRRWRSTFIDREGRDCNN
jgi:hypothetical protein